MKSIKLLGFVALLLMLPVFASAGPIYPFVQIGSNGGINVASQLSMEVVGSQDSRAKALGISLTSNQVLFVFKNDAATTSSITDVYFQDGTLLGISSIYESSGVSFAPDPLFSDLRYGGNINPAFTTTRHFAAGSTGSIGPMVSGGVNSGSEWVGIVFNLINGQTYDGVLSALGNWIYQNGNWSKSDPAAPSLRVGLFVQAIGGTNQNNGSYVNGARVPDGGSTVILLGFAVAGLGLISRRFRG